VADLLPLNRLVDVGADLARQHEVPGRLLGIDLDLVLGLLGAEAGGHGHGVIAGVLIGVLSRVVVIRGGAVIEVPGPGHLIADVLLVLLLVIVGHGAEDLGLTGRDEPRVGLGDDDVHAQGVGGAGERQGQDGGNDQWKRPNVTGGAALFMTIPPGTTGWYPTRHR